MFSNLKTTITDLAYGAVNMAEQTLSSSAGVEKKAAAVDYVVSMMPVPVIFKGLLTFVLSKFIDEAIEKAVEYMNNITNSEA